SYGLHFDLSSNTSRSSFGLFTVGDSARSETTRYKKQADSVDRPVEVYRLPRGYEISKVCVGDNATCAGPGVGSTAACYNSSTDNRFLDIVFIRPNPEPHVCIYPSAVHPDDCVNSTPFSARAIVCVKASRVGLERMIEINKGGQIRINK
ncbi:MAG: hypothetical protein WCO03_02930, partial [bacterium]